MFCGDTGAPCATDRTSRYLRGARPLEDEWKNGAQLLSQQLDKGEETQAGTGVKALGFRRVKILQSYWQAFERFLPITQICF